MAVTFTHNASSTKEALEDRVMQLEAQLKDAQAQLQETHAQAQAQAAQMQNAESPPTDDVKASSGRTKLK